MTTPPARLRANLEFRRDDLSGDAPRALLAEHLAEMHATSPAESVHALDLSGLLAEGVEVWTAWVGEELAAIGALKRLGPADAELKSMRTTAAARGTGAGRAMLRHLVAQAQGDGVVALWLETGSEDHFVPARALYASEGFTECGPFADYVLDPNSVFMTRAL